MVTSIMSCRATMCEGVACDGRMAMLPARLARGESLNEDDGKDDCGPPGVVDGAAEATSHQGSP
jgi:hypothetical protein